MDDSFVWAKQGKWRGREEKQHSQSRIRGRTSHNKTVDGAKAIRIIFKKFTCFEKNFIRFLITGVRANQDW